MALSLSDAHVAGGWCLACLASHATLCWLLTPRTVPRLSRLSPREQGSLRNTVVAAAHAVVMFVGSASYMAPHGPELFYGPLTRRRPFRVEGNTAGERLYCSLMLGYLVYDTLYGLVAKNNGADMVAHHLVGGAAWVALLLADRGGFYMMWVQLAEGSTPFLHATTALFKLGLDDTAVYSLCAAGTLVSFTLLRMVLQPLCLVSLVQSKALWGTQQALFYSMASICVAFNGLNTMWWLKLVQRAMGLARKKGGPKKAASGAAAPASSRGKKAA